MTPFKKATKKSQDVRTVFDYETKQLVIATSGNSTNDLVGLLNEM